MKIDEIRKLSDEELRRKLRSLTEELFRLRMQHGSGQLESTAALNNSRKDVARVNTVLREREIEQHGR